MPFTEVKIDRSFVMAAATSEKHRMMIMHTVEVARLSGLKVVAEGVETRAEMDLVASLGCDMIQGFLIGEPMDAGEFLHWMTARRIGSDDDPAIPLTTETRYGT